MAEPAKEQRQISHREAADEVVRASTSHDVVFAIVGYAGAGPGWVAKQLRGQLVKHGFSPIPIKLSSHLKAIAPNIDISPLPNSSTKLQETQWLQDAGAKLRTQFGDSITAAIAIRAIHLKRGDAKKVTPQSLAFVIDQVKHPKEVELLRQVYGSSFYLISVLCREDVRRKRLRVKFKESDNIGLLEQDFTGQIDRLILRDEADDTDTGQQVRRTLHRGDFFVDNNVNYSDENDDPVANEISRLIDAITGKRIVRPTAEERGMHAAWTTGLRSACLSRQVGAAILDPEGHLLAVGTNDAPKAFGGLYEEGDSADHRCFIDGKFCRNDESKKAIYNEIHALLEKAGLLAAGTSAERVRTCVEMTAVRDLIEFSRAVHAEMDALISLARDGHGSSKNATLYCTTEPCHNCARHIIAAGIKEVVYYEPYTKSRTLELHGDAVTNEAKGKNAHALIETHSVEPANKPDKDMPNKVVFRLFSGVAPRRFASLFEKRDELKKNGKWIQSEQLTARHRDPTLDRSFLQLEEQIALIAAEAESGGKAR